MRKIKKIELATIIVIIICIILLDIGITSHLKNKTEQLRQEYKSVQKDDCFRDLISDVYIAHGVCFVRLSSNMKVVPIDRPNHFYKNGEAYLSHVIEIGDVLMKEADSDSIKLCKKDKVYSYKLNFVDENEKFYEKVKR